MGNILQHAEEIVHLRSEEQERQYGPFAACMERATVIYNAMCPPEQRMSVQGMYRAMIAMKLAREGHKHKEDNLLDAVAYIGGLNDYWCEHAVDNQEAFL